MEATEHSKEPQFLVELQELSNQLSVSGVWVWSLLALVGPCQYLAGEGHCLFVSLVALLKLGLTLSDEPDHLNSRSPCVLHKRSVLDFEIKTCKCFANF